MSPATHRGEHFSYNLGEMQEKANDMDGARQMEKPVFYDHTANSGSRSEQIVAACTVFVNVFDIQGGALALNLSASSETRNGHLAGPLFRSGWAPLGFFGGPVSKNGLPKWLFFLSLDRLFFLGQKTWNLEKYDQRVQHKVDRPIEACLGAICFSPEEKHSKSAFFQSGPPHFLYCAFCHLQDVEEQRKWALGAHFQILRSENGPRNHLRIRRGPISGR